MKKIYQLCSFGIGLGLLLLFTGLALGINPAGLPGAVSLNKEAGHGGPVIVMIRLGSSETLPFLLDTGSPITCLDSSLESRLGNSLANITVRNFSTIHPAKVYAAPKLYWGDTLLTMTGTNILTFDSKRFSRVGGLTYLGILGMDVLEHYCIQFNFSARRIRFFDSDHVNRKGWGKPFSLTDRGDGCPAIRETVVGTKEPVTIIDTGCPYDGWLKPALFQQWTNQQPLKTCPKATFHYGILGDETYPWLELGSEDSLPYNGLGLRFLARHLVTFDFLNHTLYLKRTSLDPIDKKELKVAAKAAALSAIQQCMRLQKCGQLPGWAKTDRLRTNNIRCSYTPYPGAHLIQVDQMLKQGDSSIYHYELTRATKTSPWKLQKAWRTDQNSHIMEEYAIH